MNGGTGGDALCQEYLQGKEYVVDRVSLNGEHKVMMVWVYDKRAANGGSFVYFGDIPIESDTPETQRGPTIDFKSWIPWASSTDLLQENSS